MDDQQLQAFMKEYAREANNDEGMKDLLRNYGPFKANFSMGAAYTGVEDKNDNTIVNVCIRHDDDGEEIPWCPAIPIHPYAMGIAKLTAQVLNMLAEEVKDESSK